MEETRTYPQTRRKRGEAKAAGLTMLSARIADELNEYVREAAFITRKSKQEIITEAIRLHKANALGIAE